jgi:hypothetical protein
MIGPWTHPSPSTFHFDCWAQCGVYIVITAGNVKQETTVVQDPHNPVWNQTILMRVPTNQVRITPLSPTTISSVPPPFLRLHSCSLCPWSLTFPRFRLAFDLLLGPHHPLSTKRGNGLLSLSAFFDMYVWQAPVYAVIEVKEFDPVGVDTTLGTVFFPLCALPVRSLRQWFPLGRNPGSKVTHSHISYSPKLSDVISPCPVAGLPPPLPNGSVNVSWGLTVAYLCCVHPHMQPTCMCMCRV